MEGATWHYSKFALYCKLGWVDIGIVAKGKKGFVKCGK
jgi:hypothetical protein